MSKLKEVLAVVNNKGGVAKTTTVQSIAAGLIERDAATKVLVIDLDPQANLSTLCGWKPGEGRRTMFDALRGGQPMPIYKSARGVYYAPSAPELQDIDADLFRAMQPKQVLLECFAQNVDDQTGEGLTNIVSDFDYILIDCPPAMSQTTYNAMAVASGLLIPVQMEGLSVSGLGTILVEMNRVQRGLNKTLELRGILPVMVDARPRIVRGLFDYLHESYDDKLLHTYIRRCIRVNEAQNDCHDIFEYAPGCTAAKDYAALVEELFPTEE